MESRKNRLEETKKKKAKGVAMFALCSVGVVLLLAAGMFIHGAVQPDKSVQVATVGEKIPVVPMSSVAEPGLESKQEAKEEPQEAAKAMPDEESADDNPYGIDPNKPMIALTFDDGPSKYTWDIVNTLQAHKARATFFVLGNRVPTHQAAIDNVLANHNEIASHSMAHKNLTKLSAVEMTGQIRPVDEALQQQHAYTPTLFRVPYGAKNESVQETLKAEGKPIIGWSVDPYDWKVKDKDKVVEHILSHVQDGDIVLMHDIYQPTAEAVAELVPALQEKGYQLVTVSELAKFRNVSLEAGEYYRSMPPRGEK